jgi:RNA polymerase sigma-70 factor (ECF subfamily)
LDSTGEKAFLEILGKHERIIHKICHAYGSDASAKQDLFQEIILQLWKSFSSFRNESKISTWIYRIALNTAFTHHRRSKSKVTLSFFGVFDEDKAEENEEGAYQENLTLLYAAIAKLSELEKAIGEKPVILDITGGSYKKVAETKAKLESQGYEVMMVLLYASPYTTLSRNMKRDRSLDPGIVLRNWEDVIKNAEQYEQLFGADHFAFVDNDPEGANKSFDLADVESLFEKSKVWALISDEDKVKIEARIKELIDKTEDANFVAFDELATKLKGFLK